MTATIQEAARTTTTPEPTSRQTITIPQEILDKIKEKRKAKAKWQKYRTQENKKHRNKKKMKKIISIIYKTHTLNLPLSFINLPTPININYI